MMSHWCEIEFELLVMVLLTDLARYAPIVVACCNDAFEAGDIHHLVHYVLVEEYFGEDELGLASTANLRRR